MKSEPKKTEQSGKHKAEDDEDAEHFAKKSSKHVDKSESKQAEKGAKHQRHDDDEDDDD